MKKFINDDEGYGVYDFWIEKDEKSESEEEGDYGEQEEERILNAIKSLKTKPKDRCGDIGIRGDLKKLIMKIGEDNVSKLLENYTTTDSLSLSLSLLVANTNNQTTKQPNLAEISLVVGENYNNLKPYLNVYFKIQSYIESSKPIEASIIFLSYKKGICYLSLIAKLFPNKNRGDLYHIFKKLEGEGLLTITDKNNGHKDQAKIYETASLYRNRQSKAFIDSIVYYSLTEEAKGMIKPFLKTLEQIIPAHVIDRIEERLMKSTLYHSPKEHRYSLENELKRVRKGIDELWKDATIRYKFGRKLSKIVMERLTEKFGKDAAKNMTPLQYQQERLNILQEMYKEAYKRR